MAAVVATPAVVDVAAAIVVVVADVVATVAVAIVVADVVAATFNVALFMMVMLLSLHLFGLYYRTIERRVA